MPPVRYHYGKFPPEGLDLAKLLPLVEQASAAIAAYEGSLSGIPNAEVLLSPLTTREAVLSSRIEGTQVTISEVLEFEAGVDAETGEKREDIQEILNYRFAMKTAISTMEKISLSLRVVKEAHRVLMQGVRGQNKALGDFRRVPVHIGNKGGTAEDARFIPTDAGKIMSCMSNWEHYLRDDGPSLLIQLAVVHAEFESIHPFLDGNGRVGRLLIPLFMVDKNLIQHPSFYISAYLESNRDEYYDRLLAISRDDDWTGWCEFFLRALFIQGLENQNKVLEIMRLYDEMKTWAREVLRSQYGVPAVDWFFNRPIFSSSDFVKQDGIPAPTARRILRFARDSGVLKYLRPPSGRRPAILVFPELLNIAEGSKVF